MLKKLGCDRVVDYRTENLKDVLKNEFPRCVRASSGLSDSCCAAENTTLPAELCSSRFSNLLMIYRIRNPSQRHRPRV